MSQTTPQVSPEFVSILQDNAEETLASMLQALNAPAEALALLHHLRLLGMYLEKPSRHFEGIEDVTIGTINLVAECGGVFHSEQGSTVPRQSVFAKTEKAEA